MELKELQGHVCGLASLPQTSAPFISCYVRVEDGLVKQRRAFADRVEEIRGSFAGKAAEKFEEALVPVERFLSEELHRGANGAAVFSRAGKKPFFLALQFNVPLPTWIAAGTLPNIYHLTELKDTYWRFVALACSQDSIRIFAVNLGAVTFDLLRERPELRRRLGREWTKEQFQRHHMSRTQQFVSDEVKVLSDVIAAGDYHHLILAGDRKMTAMVKKALPSHITALLSGVIRKPSRTGPGDIVAESIAAFVEAEHNESRATAEELKRRIRMGSLAVAGTRASYLALKRGQVETLVMCTQYSPRPGWVCRGCGLDRTVERPNKCPACGSRSLEDLCIREAMLRLAETRGCQVEFVRDSTTLKRLGGVGCLLRFRFGQTDKTRPERRRCQTALTPTPSLTGA